MLSDKNEELPDARHSRETRLWVLIAPQVPKDNTRCSPKNKETVVYTNGNLNSNNLVQALIPQNQKANEPE